MFRSTVVCALLSFAPLLFAGDSDADVRNEIVADYQRSLDALSRGDADGAMAMDTADWVSIIAGQKPRTRQELEPFIRRDIAAMKPPADWSATWKPNYERDGTVSGIQIYDVSVEGDKATVLCLVGNSRTTTTDSNGHGFTLWVGSHVRDTWIKTDAGWKRRMHEKLTINERMIDGHPAK